MELKPGYKQTELGVIPRDWEVRSLGELGNVVRGGSPRPAGDPRYFNGTYIPWLTVAALTNVPEHQLFIRETRGFLTEEGSKHSRTLEDGTLIIANSGATLGVAKILSVTSCANDGIAAISEQRSGDKRFLCQFINSQTKKLREDIATGNGQPNLNTGLIRGIVVPFPPEPEQSAIAEALSDVDKLLSGLDKLIAKKCDLKQAAMQQLLTGQTRLKGFSGEWEIRSLGDVCVKIQDGTHFSPKLGGNDYLYVTSKNIGAGRFDASNADMISAEEHAKIYARCDVRQGDLLLTKDGANTGNAALNPLEEPFSLLSSVALLRFDGRYHVAAYFLYQILSSDGQRKITDLMSGNAITRLTLAKIRALRFPVPQVEEQAGIAAILSDMDAELAVLEARREKTSMLKQGMMQELLTGKTRLV